MKSTPVEVNLFGILVEIANTSMFRIEQAKDSDELLHQIYEQFPTFKDIPFSIAVSKNIVRQNTVLKPGDQIALLPPFSGG